MLNQLNRRTLRDHENAPAIIATRERLRAALTLYVRTDGNDGNSGRTNSAAGAFLTIQKAIDVAVTMIDPAGYGITIQVADGTYSMSAALVLSPIFGTSTITITGNTGTPANCILSFTTSNSSGFVADRPGLGAYVIQGFRLTGTTGTTNNAILVQAGFVYFNSLEFNTGWLIHLQATITGKIICNGNYAIIPTTISYHAYCTSAAYLQIGNITLTLPANMVISNAFLLASVVAAVGFFGNTVTNIATSTGSRGNVSANGVINLAGAAQTTVPGNVNITAGSGGQVV